MKIECPICSMQIEITKEHIGRKGRCDRCESKFIIPANPGDEFEILHRGEAPEKEPSTERLVLARAGAHPARSRPPIRTDLSTGGFPTGLVMGVAACVAVMIGFLIINGKGDKKPTSPKSLTELAGDADANSLPRSPMISAPRIEEPATAPEPEPEIAMADKPEQQAASSRDQPVEEQAPPLTDEQKASALTFLKSNDSRKRKGAYVAFRKLGDREKASYLQLLAEAREHYSNALGTRAAQIFSSGNALSKFDEDYAAWLSVREKAKSLVQTNWKDRDPNGYKKKHAEMDQVFEAAAKAFDRAMRATERAHKFEATGLQEIADVLGELDTEFAWCNSEVPPEPAALRDEIASTGAANDYLEVLDAISAANDIAASYDAAEQYNAGSSWAGGAYKSFASNLNERRVALGLSPLLLDEPLSDGCRDHSEDMAANGYFSHTGRTEETKSFGKRAKRAGFSGFATGECIFMGNPSAEAAHRAWWYSDGHRLIMYANNPNTLGLGLHGKHWTLNTGKK
ncbi:MAG: hypothetical protein ACI9NC_002918 [Verrucomicrobiales bacterium]|jgi:uncharacterized protein YkwD